MYTIHQAGIKSNIKSHLEVLEMKPETLEQELPTLPSSEPCISSYSSM